MDIVHRLLPLGEISYWLTKVELLQTLGCLDYTSLSLFDKKISEVILNRVVFKLIGDTDYRFVVYNIIHTYMKLYVMDIYPTPHLRVITRSLHNCRVRSMACECLVSLASTLTVDGNPLLAHLKIESGSLFSHFLSTRIEFSVSGIADTLIKPTILPPIGLGHVLWFLQLSVR